MALSSRGMTVEAARQFTKDRKEWRAWCICNNDIHAVISAWPCVLSDRFIVVIPGEEWDAVT